MASRMSERWTSRIGVILAVAGSAIGLGSFLRFPDQVARYGGGTFLVPYFCALLLVGLPLMWMEWALGRYGGVWGRHTLPGIFDSVTGRPWGRYLGVLGLFAPFVVFVFYLYVESWALGYAVLAATNSFGHVTATTTHEAFTHYLGIGSGPWALPTLGLIALLVALLLNFATLIQRNAGGIESVTRVAIPLLFVLCGVLILAVFTLPKAQAYPLDGLNFLWTIHPARLGDAQVWLAAAGQVLFSLSLALGATITFASYLRKDDDVVLSGLTSTALTQLGEVILAGTILVPAAFVFFGPHQIAAVAMKGTYSLGFATFPLIFAQVPGLGATLGTLWFAVLFFLGLTSSLSLLRPLFAFLQDELGWTRGKAATVLLLLTLFCLAPVVLLQGHGVLDELDFWAVQILLPLGTLIEVIIFAWVLGMSRGWESLTAGSRLRLPVLLKPVLQYVTPLFLLGVLGCWAWQYGLRALTLADVSAVDKPFILVARGLLGVLLVAMLLVIRFGWRTPVASETEAATAEIAVAAPVLAAVLADFTPPDALDAEETPADENISHA
jgi:SNF family Na+-dependent transporter